jgi:hypothetical protein
MIVGLAVAIPAGLLVTRVVGSPCSLWSSSRWSAHFLINEYSGAGREFLSADLE